MQRKKKGAGEPVGIRPRPDPNRSPLWFAFRTRPRTEKRVIRMLAAQGVEVEGAIVSVDRQWSDRIRRVDQPLFPGYVFARFPLQQLLHLLPTPGILHVVRIEGRAIPLRDAEIQAVRALIQGVSETGQPFEACDYLEVGREVEVVEGPFRGMTGLLLETRGRRRVTVRLAALRQAVSVDLPRDGVRVRDKDVAGSQHSPYP